MAPEIQVSYEGAGGDEHRDRAEQDTLGLANHIVDPAELGGDRWSRYDWKFIHLIREKNTITQESLDLSQVIWVTPVTASTRLRQPWSAREDEMRYLYARFCIVARVQSYSERRKRSLKRRQLEGEMAADNSELAVKKRRVQRIR